MKRDLKVEHEFLNQEQAVKTENGVFLYVSEDGSEMIQLDNYLADYREWLIKRGVVK